MSEDDECPNCLEPLEGTTERVCDRCGGSFCDRCVIILPDGGGLECPICNASLP